MGSLVIEDNKAGAGILVIEDSHIQAEHLRCILEKVNYHVRVATNCNEALNILHKSKPALIITDVIMPGMDGLALCRMIKGEERFKDIPVIILSSFASPQDVIKGLASGADNFVTKPYDDEYLLARIKQLENDRNKPRRISVPKEIGISIGGRNYTISSDRRQILNFFLCNYEQAFHNNRKLLKSQDELRELIAKLESSNTELATDNQELESFSYTVSHDLRNLLNVISSYSQTVTEICGEQLNDQCKYFINEITNRTLSMGERIDTLLKFSKLTHIKIKPELVDLSNLAQEIALGLKITEPKRKVTFEIEEGLTANGDNNLLWLMLENLIGNAWKYSSKKEETLIEFRKNIIKGKPTFFVRDNGSGFEMLDSKKLFTPFQQLSKEYEGYGIGLATVHRIIKRHSGRIWAEGEPGKGATFYFTL